MLFRSGVEGEDAVAGAEFGDGGADGVDDAGYVVALVHGLVHEVVFVVFGVAGGDHDADDDLMGPWGRDGAGDDFDARAFVNDEFFHGGMFFDGVGGRICAVNQVRPVMSRERMYTAGRMVTDTFGGPLLISLSKHITHGGPSGCI